MMLSGKEVIAQTRRMAPTEKIAQEMARGYICQRGAACRALFILATERKLLDNASRLS